MESYINLDKNMIVGSIGDTPVEWHDVRTAPFSLHGFYRPQTEPYFHRMADEAGEAVSEGVSKLQKESAGGRVRFSTDSGYIAIRAKLRVVGRSPHLTLLSSAGFDLYEDGAFGSRFVREFRMTYDMLDSYEQIVQLPKDKKMRAYTIHFPVHSVVETLDVGVEPGAAIGQGAAYRAGAPVVFYGSSIVHGTAAGRPGMIYECQLSRMLNLDFINLGFSGQAKGERAMAEYMADLDMSVFVCDYDHNAPSAEHLEATHHALYEVIREKHPDVPYIMVTRPDYFAPAENQEDTMARRDVIMRSYLKAREKGDKNVWFADGTAFFAGSGMVPGDCSMDSCHPNDAGFACMARGLGAIIRCALESRG